MAGFKEWDMTERLTLSLMGACYVYKPSGGSKRSWNIRIWAKEIFTKLKWRRKNLLSLYCQGISMDSTKLPSPGSPLSWLMPHQVQTSQLPRGTPRYEVHLCPENIFQDHSSSNVQPKCDPTISSKIINSERGWPSTRVCLGLKEFLGCKTFTTKIGKRWANQDELVRDHESATIQ